MKHLSPFNSHGICQEAVIAEGGWGVGGSDVERPEVLLQHYRESLITLWSQLWSITPVKTHCRPRVDESKTVGCLILFLSFVRLLSGDVRHSKNVSTHQP